jgi:hypothetical protein
MIYTIEQLAPGSYDVLLDGALVASLVREVDRSGTVHEWLVDLLDDTPPAVRPAPVTAQQHTIGSRGAALDWLGIHERGIVDAQAG